MSITIDETLHQISLKKLVDLSTHELQRRRWDEPGGDRYCVELFRRTLVGQTDEYWSALEQCFTETVRSWLWSHPSHDVALLRDSEENYIAQTFSRFWYAVHDQQLEFATLPAALRYLHATLNGILMDTLRSHLRGRAREVPLPEPGGSEEPATAHETNGTLLEIEFFIKPHTGKGLGAHIHPSFDERFEIITGSACYMIGQDEYSAAAGDVVVLPKAIPHVHPWNAGDDVLHVRRVIQFSKPEMSMLAATEAFLETLYALAQQGKVGKNGLPKNFLQTMVVAQAIQPATYLAGLPVVFQRSLFGALAAYGRARGYKTYYPALSNSTIH